MNRNTRILLFIFAALLICTAAWYFLRDETPMSTLASSETDFAVEQAADVHAIFLSHRDGRNIYLQRKNNSWVVNKTHQARTDMIKNILRVITKIDVRHPVSKSNKARIMGDLASNAIKVIVYGKNDKTPLRVYYIGDSDPEGQGTYTLMEGSKQPYVTHLQTWEGVLRASLVLDELAWRDRSLYRQAQGSIQKLSIEYPRQRNQSFVIEQKSNGEYTVAPLHPTTTPKAQAPDQSIIKQYLSNYTSLQGEVYRNNIPQRDSIIQAIPFATISLTSDGVTNTTDYFNIDESSGLSTAKGRYYTWPNRGKDLLVAQHFVIGKIFIAYNGFFPEQD